MAEKKEIVLNELRRELLSINDLDPFADRDCFSSRKIMFVPQETAVEAQPTE